MSDQQNGNKAKVGSGVPAGIAQMLLQEDKHLRAFEDGIEASHRRVADAAKDSKAINDEYGNSLLSIGSKDKVEKFTSYSFDNDTLNWMLWLALYNDSWVFRRAIDKPSQDEMRTGITFEGQAKYEKAYEEYNKHKTDFVQLISWGALFGGSIMCMMFDNIDERMYARPVKMSIDKLKQSKVMKPYVVDRWYGVRPSERTVSKMADHDYGKPSWYVVTLADGHSVKFHHSWVLRYEHRTAPKLVKNGMLQGWGYAEGAHIINEMMRDEKLKASVQSLINKALIEVIKMSGMRGVFMGASQDNEEQLRKRLEMVNWARDFNSLTFLDKEDEYQMNTFSGLGGLSDLLEKNMWLISAALEMQGVLYGDLKGGFSADTMALERYDETINGRCEAYVRPVLQKFFELMFEIYDIKGEVKFTFNSLLAKEQKEKQVEDLKKFCELANMLLESGVISVKQYAIALRSYTQNATIDFGLDDKSIEKLDDNTAVEGFEFPKAGT